MSYSTTHRKALRDTVSALAELDDAATAHCRLAKCADFCDGEDTERHALAPDGYMAAIQRARQATKEAIFLIVPSVTGIDSHVSDEAIKSFVEE